MSECSLKSASYRALQPTSARDRDVLRTRIALRTADAACLTEPNRPGSEIRQLAAFWPLSGLALSQVGAGLPPAAYAHYRDRLVLSDEQVTALFAFLIMGVMLVLWLCRLSLAGTRRGPALAAALALAAAADLLFISGNSYLSLAVASGLLGCSVGGLCALAPGVITAVMPGGDRASSWVTAANAAGLAAGPVIAGAVNQLLPLPYVLVYAAHALVCLIVAAALVRAPPGSAVVRRRGTASLRSQPGYQGALLRGYLAFAVGGLISSLAAVLAKDEFGLTSSAVTGSLIAAFFTANALVGGLVIAGLPARAGLIGRTFLVLGLAISVLAVATKSPPLLIAAIMLAGGGQGCLIGVGILTAARVDGATGGNTAVAVFFLWCYAGAVTAAITVGLVSSATSPGHAFLLELAVIIASLLVVDLLDSRRGAADA
jgi:hypothetical protein